MPKITYVSRRFSHETQVLLMHANNIIAEYAAQGFTLTLRQLYYQFVARDMIENSQKSYKRLGARINDGRLAGLVDWSAIVDRTRNLQTQASWDRPSDILYGAWQGYREDKWRDQPRRVEVWIEKDALVGVIAGVCEELQVPYFSCRGYTSQSEMWSASRRFTGYHNANQTPSIIHLGDHDPSGMDMSRDIMGRLSMFCYGDLHTFPVDRVALNMDQIEKYQPPPNPAKLTDSRCSGYTEAYGKSSWELDALEPQVMADLIRDAVTGLRDQSLWDEAVKHEADARATLEKYYLEENDVDI